jgi:DNA-binding response OmpR family regulator
MHQPPSHPILLAEEQAVSRDLVVLVLGKLGYRIETVTTAHDALQRVGSSQPSLVLLSTSLPGRAGGDLLREIRAGAHGAMPVAMIGAQTDDCSSEAWLEAGAIDYLGRPIDIERLLRVVERAVRSRPPTSRADQDPQPVIDLDHLFEFTDGDRQLEGELLTLFLSSADVYLARMSEALRAGQSWAAVAHALKGASANLGASRVMEVALAAERSPPSAAQLVALGAAIEEVRGFDPTRPERL